MSISDIERAGVLCGSTKRAKGRVSAVLALAKTDAAHEQKKKQSGDAGNRTRVEEKGHPRPTCVVPLIFTYARPSMGRTRRAQGLY